MIANAVWQPWLTDQPWSTVVDFKCLFLPFFSESPMAEPWSANQAGTKYPL